MDYDLHTAQDMIDAVFAPEAARRETPEEREARLQRLNSRVRMSMDTSEQVRGLIRRLGGYRSACVALGLVHALRKVVEPNLRDGDRKITDEQAYAGAEEFLNAARDQGLTGPDVLAVLEEALTIFMIDWDERGERP